MNLKFLEFIKKVKHSAATKRLLKINPFFNFINAELSLQTKF